jgi:DNA-nicking Smr family endonuclease
MTKSPMKPSNPSGTYRPFENLKGLLEEQAFPLASKAKKKPQDEGSHKVLVSADEEEKVFHEAMAGVVPIEREYHAKERGLPSRPRVEAKDPEAEALARLEDLVKGGEGFTISDTSEYMEGIGYGVNREIAERLHRGDFSVQDHLDLHGLSVQEALEAFETFMKEAVLLGKRAVLIVHGRGRSSRDQPVLKVKVKEWLASGTWRKWVVAFTSARACDGGTGATYVLLRERPVTKRHRKRGRKR